jgi:hypothetical protein
MPAARRLERIAVRGSNANKQGATGTLVHVQERRSRRLGLDRENPGVSGSKPCSFPIEFPWVNVRCYARLDSVKKTWPGGKDSSHFRRRADRDSWTGRRCIPIRGLSARLVRHKRVMSWEQHAYQ